MTERKKCSYCGYEEDPDETWMQFYEFEEKKYCCSVCIMLALHYRDEYEHVKSKGFKIVVDSNYKCVECERPASKDSPQYAYKNRSICITCIGMALTIKREVEKSVEQLEKYWSKIEN